MGFFRFRRSVKILPGVRWNLNKGGSSFTFGPRGFKYTVGSKGARTTVGIPGTGISYTQVHSSGGKGPPPLPSASTQMPSIPQKSGINKTGCWYAAGLALIGIWLLSFLSNLQTPSASRQTAPSASPAVPVSSPFAAIPAVAPTYVPPEPSVTILRATRVRSAAEETRLKKFIPPRVRLRQDLEFRATSQNATIPSVFVGQGREVNVVRVNGSELVVEHGGWQAMVSISKTDFLDRVIAEAEK